MQAAYERGMDKVLAFLRKVQDQRHLYSVRTAFVSVMPLMIIGAFAVVILQMPIAAYQNFMDSLFGQTWRTMCELVHSATMQIVSLCAVFMISSNLSQWYANHGRAKVHGGLSGLVSLAAYFVLTLPTAGLTSLPFSTTSVNSMFVAMIVSILATEFFVALCSLKKSSVHYSEDSNRTVSMAFDSIFPSIAVVVVAVLIRLWLIIGGFTQGLSDIVNSLLARPFDALEDPFATAQLFNVSTHVMWTFGLHGNNVLDQIAQSIFVPAIQENAAMAAAGFAPPNLITKTLFDSFVYMGGSGATMGLLLAILIFGKARSYKTLLKYALPQSLMNINEPVVFGLPIVLNPVFALPFVLVPVVTLSTTTLAMTLGWVPYTTTEVIWCMPIFFSGYIATGSVSGVVMQAVNLALATLIYAPFVKLSERLQKYRFAKTYQELGKSIADDYGRGNRHLTERADEVGVVARRLANDLQSAIANRELFLVYQPIVNARDNVLHSVEALLRWKHPEYGLINPLLTVGLAEEIGSIQEIGLWVLEESIKQRLAWTEQGMPSFHISVNASSLQLEDARFADQVVALLKRYNLPEGEIQVEVTEALALAEDENTQNNFSLLFENGVTIAMDDFGVGHSSLTYLRTRPITCLKIDGALSRDVLTSPANLEIISTINELCKLFSMEMIVEYVESREQLEKLMTVGAYLIQGYYYSPPIAPDKLDDFCKTLLKDYEPIRVEAEEGLKPPR